MPAWQCTSRCEPSGNSEEVAAEVQESGHVLHLRWRRTDGFVDYIVKTQLQSLVLAKAAEHLRHRPIRIQDRENVARARLTMVRQLLDATDRHPERCYRVHRLYSIGPARIGHAGEGRSFIAKHGLEAMNVASTSDHVHIDMAGGRS